MQQIHRYELLVPKEAEDQNGHVNNVEYLRWMQDAAMQHSEITGCTAATNAVGATWVVRTHKIEYFKPAFAGDRVVIVTWIADFRACSLCANYKSPARRTMPFGRGRNKLGFRGRPKGHAALHSQGGQGRFRTAAPGKGSGNSRTFTLNILLT
jgi:YbgC/YbaW family acyl-CoA thioester hydrolase